MTDLAKLVVKLEAQTAQYQKQLEMANKKMSRFQRQQQKALQKVGGAFKTLAAGLGAGLFLKATNDALQFADSMQKLSIRTSASTEFLSELRFAAEQSGVQFDRLTNAISLMQDNTIEAVKGMKAQSDAFKALNLNAKAFADLTVEQQFQVLADRISQVDNAAQRTNIARDIFGRSGAEFIQLAQNGAEGLNQLRQEARELGLTLSRDAADKAAAANDAMNRLRRANTALSQSFAIQLGPTIEKVSNFMANNLQPVVSFVGRAFDGLRFVIIKTVQAMVFRIQQLIGLVAKLPDSLGGGWAKEAAASLQLVQESLNVTADGFFQGAVAVQKFNAEVAKIPGEISVPTSELDLLQEIDVSQFDELRLSTDEVMSSIKDKTASVSDQIAGTLAGGFQNGFDSIGESFKGLIANMLAQFVQSGISNLIQGLLMPGGGAGAGGILGAVSSFLPGFATGANFEVGGRGGVDSNLVAFRATRGEKVNITRAGDSGNAAAGPASVTFNVTGDVTPATRKELQRMVMDGTLGSMLNQQQQRQGSGPVFKGN